MDPKNSVSYDVCTICDHIIKYLATYPTTTWKQLIAWAQAKFGAEAGTEGVKFYQRVLA